MKPDEIDSLIELLRKAWKVSPDLKFGEIISIAANDPIDVKRCSNEVFERGLKKIIGSNSPN